MSTTDRGGTPDEPTDDEREPTPPKPGEKWTGLSDAVRRSRGGPARPCWPVGFA